MSRLCCACVCSRKKAVPGIVLLVSLYVAVVNLTGCFGSLTVAPQQAQKLAADMHEKMARGDLAGIYNAADERYRQAVTREKSDALFSSVARKLGSPQDCKLGNTFFQVTTSGTFIKSVCTTTFSKNATGVETFVWFKSGTEYRLGGYFINSNELIER